MRPGWELSLVGQNLLEPSHVEFGPPGPQRYEFERGVFVRSVWVSEPAVLNRMLHSGRLVRALAAVVVSLGVMWGGASAAAGQSGEDAVKAAFLYNFTKFIEWPEASFSGSSAPFNVCVFADRDFRRELQAILMGERVRGRPIEVVVPADAGEDLRQCHIVYFAGEEHEAASRLPALRQTPVLTVGEGRQFLDRGGVIAFLLENNRVRFDISKRGADSAGLNVSSKLLRVARQVDGAPVP